MTATWVAIGVLGAFAAAVLAMVFQILGKVDGVEHRLDAKIDGLRSELKGDIARVEGTVASIDTKLGRTNERIDALYRHLAIPEGHPV